MSQPIGKYWQYYFFLLLNTTSIHYCAPIQSILLILQQLFWSGPFALGPSGVKVGREKRQILGEYWQIMHNWKVMQWFCLRAGGCVGVGWPSGAIVGEIEIQFIGARCQHQPCHRLDKQIKWSDRNLQTRWMRPLRLYVDVYPTALSNHCTVAWVTWPERPKDKVKQARRAQSRPKGPLHKVEPRRGP